MQSIRESLCPSNDTRQPSTRVLRYKQKAIRILRAELARRDNADDKSLMAMLFLAVTEVRKTLFKFHHIRQDADH
jgi:transcription initiation factor IIE alpha subunit